MKAYELAAEDWWEPCRQRELSALSARTVAILTDLDRELDDPETVSELRTLKLSREWVSKPGWVPSRGKPRLPSLLKIAGYWADLGVVDDISIPFCFRCGWVPLYSEAASAAARWRQASRYLDRAHLVDRAAGGLDQVQNLMPLCWAGCHRIMPPFLSLDDGNAALEWVLNGAHA